MDYEELPAPDMTPVRLLDRLEGAPAYERAFNGYPSIKKKAGQEEFTLPRHVAMWLWQKDRDKIWAKDGGFVHRFALLDPNADGNEEIVARCGRDILAADPIQADPVMREGWDVNTAARPRREVTYTELSGRDLAAARQLLSERQAGAATFVRG